MKNSLYILAFLITLIGCRPKPLIIDLPEYKPKLVIASQIIPGKTMVVSVMRSFTVLSKATENDTVKQNFLDDLLVKNALVTVKYDNKKDTLFRVSDGVYASITTLQLTNGFYELYVYDPESKLEITASEYLLPHIPFDTAYPVITKNAGDTTIEVNYTFTDDPAVENYYVVNFILKKTNASASLDINGTFNTGQNKLTNFELISDKTYPDKNIAVKTKLSGVTPNDTLAITISNVSQGYFEYLNARKRSGNIFTQLTGEPVNYPTNVIGGFGYFSIHYPDIRIFNLKDY